MVIFEEPGVSDDIGKPLLLSCLSLITYADIFLYKSASGNNDKVSLIFKTNLI